MAEQKYYTWEEKIDCLAMLAKAAGTYLDAEEGMISPSTGYDSYKDARRSLMDAYEEFCQWRHAEPYVVDEIKALLAESERPLTQHQIHNLAQQYRAIVEAHGDKQLHIVTTVEAKAQLKKMGLLKE